MYDSTRVVNYHRRVFTRFTTFGTNNFLSSWGHGFGQVVGVLPFYSDNPSSNPAGYLNFLYEKTKIIEKEAGVGPP